MKTASKIVCAVTVKLLAIILVSAQISVAPENRCTAYIPGDYSYPQSIEDEIIAREGGKIASPYTGEVFLSKRETDIEHIVARSEAHDSGLCSAPASVKRQFARDLANLTLASPSLNRYQKGAKDLAEWQPSQNVCWFAQTVVVVKAKYNLSMDRREAAAALQILNACGARPLCQFDDLADALNCHAGIEAPVAGLQDARSGCFPYANAYVTATMNVRERPLVNGRKLGTAPAGAYPVTGSVNGDNYCWIDIGDGWMADTGRVSGSKPATQTATRAQQSAAVQQSAKEQQPGLQPAAQVSPLTRYDDNRNGRITCAEARKHGIAPVRREHPAYPYMDDRDGDGIVCE